MSLYKNFQDQRHKKDLMFSICVGVDFIYTIVLKEIVYDVKQKFYGNATKATKDPKAKQIKTYTDLYMFSYSSGPIKSLNVL